MSASNAVSRMRRVRRAASVTAARNSGGVDRQSAATRAAITADLVFARVAFFTEQDHAGRKRAWRRFPLAGAGSGFALFLLLLGFACVLKPRVKALPPSSAILATLVEPPPKPPEPQKVTPAPPATIAPNMKPRRHTHREPPKPKPRTVAPPPIPQSATSSLGSIPVAPSKESAPPAPAAPGPAGESGGAEAGMGGSDSGGARAIYAPLPKIPDELRENAFSTVAVAHFVVGPDGTVQVTLITPTPEPKLNQLILETLHEWKFFPAIKDGVAIASQFDVRIPISVQ